MTVLQHTMSGRQEDELNFGHSGYVYLPSDSASRIPVYTKCQYYDVNVTICSFMNKTLKTTQEIILIRASMVGCHISRQYCNNILIFASSAKRNE